MRRRTRRHGRVWATAAALAAAIGAGGLVLDELSGIRAHLAVGAVDGRAFGVAPARAGFERLFEAGIEALKAGDAHRAARLFETARQRRPHVPEVLVNLGFAYLALGRPEEAAAAFETAVAMRPGQGNAYFGLAESHEQLGDLEAALGSMTTYAHLVAPSDPHRRRAIAAIWEWRSEIERRRTAPVPGPTDEPATPAGRAPPPMIKTGELSLQNVEGGVETWAAFAGKTMIINVWATWCAPCRAELPSLQRLRERLDPERFEVIGLSVDKDADFVREFLREVGVTYPNYVDASQRVAAGMFGVRSFPQTLVVGPGGAVLARVVGARDWQDPAVIDRIARRER